MSTRWLFDLLTHPSCHQFETEVLTGGRSVRWVVCLKARACPSLLSTPRADHNDLSRVPTGRENLEKVRNQISFFKALKSREFADKVRKGWEMGQTVRKR